MDIGTLIYTKLFCRFVGEDIAGNRYFISRCKAPSGRYKRSIIYNGEKEASKTPLLWQAWLNYITDDIPDPAQKGALKEWEVEKLPNLTGTKYRYNPRDSKNQRQKAAGDYIPWNPNNR